MVDLQLVCFVMVWIFGAILLFGWHTKPITFNKLLKFLTPYHRQVILIAYNLFADSSGLSYGKITVIRQEVSF